MIDSIGSADDILAWADYLSLPADGWEGDGESPSVDTAMNMFDVPADSELEFSPLGLFSGKAVAAKRFTKRRIVGGAFGRILAKIAAKGSGEFLKDPVHLSKAIKDITKGAQITLNTDVRKIIHTDTLISATTRLVAKGQRNVKEVMRGRKDQRVHPALILDSIAYLETSLVNETLTDTNSIRIELAELYASIFLTGDSIRSKAKRDGAMFHLIMAAYYQAKNEFADGLPIFDLEGARSIVYSNNNGRYLSYLRKVDIVLGENNSEIWVELKSKKWPFNKGEFGKWTLTTSRKIGSIHKQFFSDRVARYLVRPIVDYTQIVHLWRFQSFKAKDGSRGPKENEITQFKLREKLCRLPKTNNSNSDVIKFTTGVSDVELERLCLTNRFDILRIQNNKTILNELVSHGLLGDIPNIIGEELLGD